MTNTEKTRLLAERVMGWNVRQTNSGKWVAMIPDGDYISTVGLCEYSWTFKTWAPLTDLSHAGEVLEAMRAEGWWYEVCDLSSQHIFTWRKDDKHFCATADSLQTAICNAALLAHEVKEEEL